MDDIVPLGVSIGAASIGVGIWTYIKIIKKRMRKHILRGVK